MTFFEITVL